MTDLPTKKNEQSNKINSSTLDIEKDALPAFGALWLHFAPPQEYATRERKLKERLKLATLDTLPSAEAAAKAIWDSGIKLMMMMGSRSLNSFNRQDAEDVVANAFNHIAVIAKDSDKLVTLRNPLAYFRAVLRHKMIDTLRYQMAEKRGAAFAHVNLEEVSNYLTADDTNTPYADSTVSVFEAFEFTVNKLVREGKLSEEEAAIVEEMLKGEKVSSVAKHLHELHPDKKLESLERQVRRVFDKAREILLPVYQKREH